MTDLKHIAFIMDGNGRWAKKRNLPRISGHIAGLQTVKKVVKWSIANKIEIVSLFVFSTENWLRPQSEIDSLFKLARQFIKEEKSFLKQGVNVVVSGDAKSLPIDLQNDIKTIENSTKDCKNLILNLCINYGGRDEIINAVNNIIKDKVAVVDNKIFEEYLYTSKLANPDIIVRTSGEMRLSNFLLYQSAYSELYFTDVLWPDFSKEDFEKVLNEFNKRNRKFGKIEEH